MEQMPGRRETSLTAPSVDISATNGPVRGSQRGNQSDPSSPNRKLPRWAIVALALAIGWALGLVASTRLSNPVAEDSTAAPTLPADLAAPTTLAVPTVPPEGLVSKRHVTFVMAQAPLRGISIPPDVRVIADGESTVVQLEPEQQISGLNQGSLGQPRRRIVATDDVVVFMASEAVMMLDLDDLSTPPTQVAVGVSLLRGSSDTHVWIVGSGSNSVADLDVADPLGLRTYDLAEVGVPLASVRDGLLIAPVDRELGAFALWSPRRGIEPLDVGAAGSFIGASGDTIALRVDGRLATYDLFDGALTRTTRAISASESSRSLISPGGKRLAIVERGSITELPVVVVVDTATGERVDEFASAFAWQLQWVSDREMLFTTPMGQAIDIRVRDTDTSTDTFAAALDGPNYWVTIAS